MNERVKNCYELLLSLEGTEINEILRAIPLPNLICLITFATNIFHDVFFKHYNESNDRALQ